MSNSLKRQSVFYIFVGVSSALLELGLFELFYEIFHINVAVSNVVAIIIATVYNFLLNYKATFQGLSAPFKSMLRYALVFVANMFITTSAIGALISVGVPSAIAKLIMQACVAVWNFFLYRYFVFRERPQN